MANGHVGIADGIVPIGGGPLDPPKIVKKIPGLLLPDNVTNGQAAFYERRMVQTQSIWIINPQKGKPGFGQITFQSEDLKLKVILPIPEWHVILRQIQSLNPVTWVDTTNQCAITFKPYISSGLFEIAIELSPITVGERFKELITMTNCTATR